MSEIAPMTDNPSPPDLYVEPQESSFVVVANRKARKIINKAFEKPRPQWGTVTGSSLLRSLEYRTLEIAEGGEAGIAAILCAAHRAGLFASYCAASAKTFTSLMTNKQSVCGCRPSRAARVLYRLTTLCSEDAA